MQPEDFHRVIRDLAPEIDDLLKGTHDVASQPLSVELLAKLLLVRPYSEAVYRIVGALPLPLNPSRRRNQMLFDLNLVRALSLSFGARHGLALIIDYDTGEEYDSLVEIAKRLGAKSVGAYLVAGQTACGGTIPPDEMERAELSERYERELRKIDLAYASTIEEELEQKMIEALSKDPAESVRLLNEILR